MTMPWGSGGAGAESTDVGSQTGEDTISGVDLDPDRLREFVRMLREFDAGRLQSAELWRVFEAAFPHRPRGAEPRRWFLAALHRAAAEGVIRIPIEHGRRWDRSLRPPVPASVDRERPPAAVRNRIWRDFPWHPCLAWVADLAQVSPEQEAFLRLVHYGLVNGQFEQPAPLKYRSLQLTGHEKALSKLAKTVLFGPGRLSLDLLGCIPNILPLALQRVGGSAVAIVFENVDAFKVACGVLAAADRAPYGMVGFGGGAAFVKSVLHFGQIPERVERIEYVGDLDRPGLQIASRAAHRARMAHLPPVVPARDIHWAMLQAVCNLGHPAGLPYEAAAAQPGDEELVAWLPEYVRSDVLVMLQAGRRVPEEVLGPEEFRELWT